MKREMVRRFTWAEVLLHWGYALLYLVLFATGTLLLAGRLSGRPILPHEILRDIHRLTGVLFVAFLVQTLILSILAADFRCLWRTPLECIRWGAKDLLWLLKVPFNTISRRVVLPPAGRFNAGQKLHVLLVSLVLIGFSVSGLIMILVPGVLAAWIVHLACFVPAAGFLALHLFLALINPETRKSLPSIFSGHVTRDYARQHHGLWIGDVDSEHGSSYVSLTAILIVAGVLVAILTLVGIRHREIPGKRTILATIEQRGTNAISPAPLAAVHAGEAVEGGNCTECHSLFEAPSSTKCLECHEEIKARLAGASGYHGTLTGPCRECHREHQGREASLIHLDRAAFNHTSANFHLQGKHQAVPCEDCHQTDAPADATATVRTRFIGLAYESCTSCHADPHRDRRASDCLRCHTMDSWDRAALTFDHNRDSRFRLEGTHTGLDCRECHSRRTTAGQVSIRLFDIGDSCRDCHADPHRGQFDKACDECHNERGWKGRRLTSFHAPDSSFPLVGKHAKLSCGECHRVPERTGKLAEAEFAGLSRECQSCHQDPHEGQMSHACDTCHRETGWKGANLLFAHERHTSFRLDPLHSALACSACHGREQKRYRPLPHECGNCHTTQQSAMQGASRAVQTPPDPHFGRLACTDCHDVNRPGQSLADYARRCTGCHNDEYGQLAYEWARTLRRRESLVEQLMESRNEPVSKRVRADLAEARQSGFHNLNLTRRLYDHIVRTLQDTGNQTMVMQEEKTRRTGVGPDVTSKP